MKMATKTTARTNKTPTAKAKGPFMMMRAKGKKTKTLLKTTIKMMTVSLMAYL